MQSFRQPFQVAFKQHFLPTAQKTIRTESHIQPPEQSGLQAMLPVIAQASPSCTGDGVTSQAERVAIAGMSLPTRSVQPSWTCDCWCSSEELRHSLAKGCTQLLLTVEEAARVPPKRLFTLSESTHATSTELATAQPAVAKGSNSVQLPDSDQHLAIVTVWHELTASARSTALLAAQAAHEALQAYSLSPEEATPPNKLYKLVESLTATKLGQLPASLLWAVLHELATAQSYATAAGQLTASAGGVALVNVPSVQLPLGVEQRMAEHEQAQEHCLCAVQAASPTELTAHGRPGARSGISGSV